MVENSDFKAPSDPWALFREWFALAEANEPNDPNAMSLATAGGDGMPSARIVLLKSFDEKGLVFFTNRQSQKGLQLGINPKAAICLYWKSLRRQIRAEGMISAVSDAESDAYFSSRPRGAQIGAWASEQSQELDSRAVLEAHVREFEQQFEGKPVQRPPHWGGYRLTPLLIEFWQDREFRLHDRILYRRANAKDIWMQKRLYP